jgi:hypothetical protein
MNFFKDIVTDMDKVEQEFLGPDYSYHKQIRNPSELGMSGDGNVKALSRDIAGIIDYVELLVSGSGPASKNDGKPLGDKYFLKTGGQCKDYKTGKLVTRSMYIDNIPTSKLPIISNLSGMSFPDFRGIVPGMLEDIYDINPLRMFSAFMEGNEPACAEVSLDTVGKNNQSEMKSGYIPIAELRELQNDGKIPDGTVSAEMLKALDGSVNKESFINLFERNMIASDSRLKSCVKCKKQGGFNNIYMIMVSLLFAYIALRMIHKK